MGRRPRQENGAVTVGQALYGEVLGIQQRADVKRYAMGVLGLGSLLLTQIRYERAARVQEAEALAATDVDAKGG